MKFGWLEVVEILGILAGQFWQATLGMALVLAIAGFLLRRWRGWRRSLFALAGLVVVYQVAWWGLTWKVSRTKKQAEVNAQTLRQSLLIVQPKPETVYGFTVPPNAKVQWQDAEHKQVDWLNLPSPTLVLGVMMIGHVQFINYHGREQWAGTLALDTVIDGWPCAAEEVRLTPMGA